MAKPIDLVVTIDAPIDRVWAELADFGSHPQWMDDAATVRFLTEQTTGVGTQIEVETRVGPLRATDFMNVVGWEEGQSIVVEHRGSVTGSGRFEVRPLAAGTEMRWWEDLRFPWWMGGPVGLAIARPIFRRMWRGSLERLRERLEISGP